MTTGYRDYHVHYYADGCAHAEMTLPNIAAEASRLGINEVCVLKHYSQALPNNEAVWVCWKRIIPAQFAAFIQDIRSFAVPAGMRMLAGVETELVNDDGDINIPPEESAQLDAIILSVHWWPHMALAKPDPSLLPGNIEASPAEALAAWRATVQAVGAEVLLANLVTAYVRAIERHPRVCVLGHMFDGLLPLRSYAVPVDALDDARLITIMDPLFRACASRQVLWELTPDAVVHPALLTAAHVRGVRFCATADAHFLQTPGWGNLHRHATAEAFLDQYRLTRGKLEVDMVTHP